MVYSGNLLIIQSFNPSLLLLLQSELLSSHPQPVENTTTRLFEALPAVEMSSQILHCPGLISIFFKDDLPFPRLDWALPLPLMPAVSPALAVGGGGHLMFLVLLEWMEKFLVEPGQHIGLLNGEAHPPGDVPPTLVVSATSHSPSLDHGEVEQGVKIQNSAGPGVVRN